MTHRLIRIEDCVKVLSTAIAFLGFLSVARYVELSYSAAFASLFLLSLFFEYRRQFPLPRWLLTCMALGVIFVTVLRMNADDFIDLTVGALLILLAIKLLGVKRFRDYMQIYIIALFLLIGSALLSTDIEFLLYLVGVIFLVTTTVVLLTYYSQDAALALPASTIARIASRTSLISIMVIPVTVVIFLVLPRTGHPVFHFLNKGPHAGTGFTDRVSLGKVSDIQEDPAVVLRAHMEKVPDDSLYWRGIVLDYFDGTSWMSLYGEVPDDGKRRLSGAKQISQTIYLEPYGNRYLFALDRPTSLYLRHAKKTAALTYTFPENIHRRIKYDSVSALSDALPEQGIDRAAYLQMPERDFGQMKELVKTLSSGRNSEETVTAILRFLRDGEYRYSLSDLPLSENPLEGFLFVHKYGNCEYFASAMAVMLRIAGIPSRVVGGYRGGYYNDAGEYYLVPQKNAHVWVEVYLEDKGWLRMDPTPAGFENYVSGSSVDLLFRIRLLMDSMNFYWNAMVINYDFTKQVSLFNKLRSAMRKPRLHLSLTRETLVRYFPAFLCLALVIFTTYHLAFRRKATWEKVLHAFLKKMDKHGYRKKRSEGLEEFVSGIRDEEVKQRAYAFVTEFENSFYRDRTLTREEIKRLKRIIKW
jgi:transglutaminase-like putative cysteine protease